MFIKMILNKYKPVLPQFYILSMFFLILTELIHNFGFLLLLDSFFDWFHFDLQLVPRDQMLAAGLFFVAISVAVNQFAEGLFYLARNPDVFFDPKNTKNCYSVLYRIITYLLSVSCSVYLLTELSNNTYELCSFVFGVLLVVSIFCYICIEYLKRRIPLIK